MNKINTDNSFYNDFVYYDYTNVEAFFKFMELPDRFKNAVYAKYGNGIDNEPTKERLKLKEALLYKVARYYFNNNVLDKKARARVRR